MSYPSSKSLRLSSFGLSVLSDREYYDLKIEKIKFNKDLFLPTLKKIIRIESFDAIAHVKINRK